MFQLVFVQLEYVIVARKQEEDCIITIIIIMVLTGVFRLLY